MTRPMQIAALAALLAASLVYLGLKTLPGTDTIDFKYIWLAGELWRDGLNPYSEVFVETGRVLFAGYNTPDFWVYPPNWWPLAAAASLPDYETAGILWRLASAACLVAGCLILSATADRMAGPLPFWRHVLFWACVATMSATAITMALGQTSALTFLGICLFVLAWLTEGRAVMFAALVLIALKPTAGLVFAALLVPSVFWWPSLLAAGAAAALMALPGFLQHGTVNVLSAMMARLGEYGTVAVNTPPEMTGIRHIADAAFGIELGSLTCVGIGIVAMLALGAWLSRHGSSLRAPGVALALTVVAFTVPLHTYDLIFLAIPVVLTAQLPPGLQAGMAAGLACIWRPNNLEGLFNVTDPQTIYFPGSLLASVAALAMMVLLIIALGLPRLSATHARTEKGPVQE